MGCPDNISRANADMDPGERRERSRRGGVASGKKRRLCRTVEDFALGRMHFPSGMKKACQTMKLDPGKESSRLTVFLANALSRALKGDRFFADGLMDAMKPIIERECRDRTDEVKAPSADESPASARKGADSSTLEGIEDEFRKMGIYG